MKVCIIGNSHLAALKLAIDNGALVGTGADIVFFGTPGPPFKKVRFRKGAVRGPKSLHDNFLNVSGGRYTRIDPAEFDVVVIYAGNFYFHKLVGNIHHTLGCQVHLTEDCLSTGVERWVTSRHAFRLANAIAKAAPTTRTILVPRPIPAIGAATEPETVDRNMEIPWLWDTLEAAFRKKIWNICRQTAAQKGVELLLQPESTIDANQFTKAKYTSHSTRLLGRARAHEPSDVKHMNAEFGEVVLMSLLAYLTQTTKFAERVQPIA